MFTFTSNNNNIQQKFVHDQNITVVLFLGNCLYSLNSA